MYYAIMNGTDNENIVYQHLFMTLTIFSVSFLIFLRLTVPWLMWDQKPGLFKSTLNTVSLLASAEDKMNADETSPQV